MIIINASLRGKTGYYSLECEGGKFKVITAQNGIIYDGQADIDAKGNLLCAPFVEPHIHLDAVLTAGEPNWNMSGTLFEGIERWSERKPMLSIDDVQTRVLKTVELLLENGIQHIRTHVDVTDPDLVALRAINDLRPQLAPYIDLQIVAFPQEGILSYPNGTELMEKAIEHGADVIGGIPHFEYTREYGVKSVEWLMDLAEKHNKLVDVHCDEIDDEASRFLEVLATVALEKGMGERVTASHTTAMHSYNNAYCYKLFRLLKKSKINFISCPTESIHLQGRFDTYPKRRGITRVKEIRDAGMNICFAQDSIQDPWYSLGNGKLLRVLDSGLHSCHMMGYEDLSTALDLITDNGAKTLNIAENYGIEVGKPANFIILEGQDDVDVIKRQGEVLYSVRKGEILIARLPASLVNKVSLIN
ncbi:cytosine deaminase [Vibrio natriegens]|jgi:cytosine deaminase|uniref:cytosine deaminase n=1 Tax=Vibrio TaxID=662 RepID=UPI000803CEB5|nr:cytosine deaminase [Vibrio natriegens]ANQ27975.1 cytosine deaminase [Vibrio natriegens]MCY9878762.1 cytosine deaminase [Vibrio natriegens]MEE3879283.1 cytosine deaminase [Vibrio sp. YYF0003]